MIITNIINQFINSIVITIISIIKFKFIKIIDEIQIVKKIVNNFEFFHSQKFLLLINDKNVAFDSRKNSKFFLFVEFDNVKLNNNNNKKNRF